MRYCLLLLCWALLGYGQDDTLLDTTLRQSVVSSNLTSDVSSNLTSGVSSNLTSGISSSLSFQDTITSTITTPKIGSTIDWVSIENTAEARQQLIDLLVNAKLTRTFSPDYTSLDNREHILDIVRIVSWWKQQIENPPTVQHISLPESINYIQAVADLRVPKTTVEASNQLQEAAWFKTRGYNTLVVTFLGETDLTLLEENLKQLSASGWRFILGPSGKYQESIYIDPEIYRKGFELIGPYCEFALCGWRDLSSGRHWREDEARMRLIDLTIIQSLVRESNPNLPIVGESIYYISESETFQPEWSSGILIANAGHVDGFMVPNPENIAKRYPGKSLFAVITGASPRTKNPTSQLPTIHKLSRYVETKYRECSLFKGCITLIGCSKLEADSLCNSRYHITLAE